MSTVAATIKRLLPEGTNASGATRSRACPDWPPDVFAVAAALIEGSGCYCLGRYTVGWDVPKYYFTHAYRKRIHEAAEGWQQTGKAPLAVQQLWRSLLTRGSESLLAETVTWQDMAIDLLAIADEASAGVGFSDPGSLTSPFARFLLDQHAALLKGQPLALRYIPQSICSMVPPAEVCVQPKTNTPEVGCTVRSLTHHLALLPSAGLVATSWLFSSPRAHASERRLNLLLVPFPYVVQGQNFSVVSDPLFPRSGFFSIDPASWLNTDAVGFADFLIALVKAAGRETAAVHGIILPEASLPIEAARQIAALLAKNLPDLELFIAGTVDVKQCRNLAYTCRFFQRAIFHEQTQSKHHRWRIERSQITRYHLGTVLDPNVTWWEQIDVQNRSCVFTEIREGASIAVLVCEDLARADPVLPIISSIGPNLVVALLMDGPQVEGRWSARYATVLADDPGSSVLTFTCHGMVRRFTMPGEPELRQVALWKEPGGSAKEIQLPQGYQALLLTLSFTEAEQSTLDMRVDDTATLRLHLSGVRGVRVAEPPSWLELD